MAADLGAGEPAPRPEVHGSCKEPAAEADLELTLQADALSVRHALRVMQLRLAGTLPEAVAGTLELVLAEVLNNIVEHAYRGEGGSIELCISARPGALVCRVADQGVPMPGGELPDPPRPDPALAIEDLPEGGFGWMMIRELAQDLQYRRDAGRNELRFRLSLG